jgi:26S proteasome regulatory subunit N2
MLMFGTFKYLFIYIGKEESADEYIKQMVEEADPILRFGGMYMIALAYAGTGHNKAIKKLLHFASSDVSDDVRRASVISLSFVLINNPK